MTKLKVLIFGGSGFIGSELLKTLCEQRDRFEVYVLMHHSPINDLPACAKVISGSINVEGIATINSIHPDIIFHCARINSRHGAIGRRFSAWRGMNMNRKLIHAIRHAVKTPLIIYCSGSLMYGPGRDHLETDPLKPVSFAKQYIKAEQPLLDAHLKGYARIAIARLPWILGNGSWFKQLYLEPLNKHGNLTNYSHSNMLMDILTLPDLTNALIQLAVNNTTGIFNLTYGAPLYYEEFTGMLKQLWSPEEVRVLSSNQSKKQFESAFREAFETEITMKSLYPKESMESINSHQRIFEYLKLLAKHK